MCSVWSALSFHLKCHSHCFEKTIPHCRLTDFFSLSVFTQPYLLSLYPPKPHSPCSLSVLVPSQSLPPPPCHYLSLCFSLSLSILQGLNSTSAAVREREKERERRRMGREGERERESERERETERERAGERERGAERINDERSGRLGARACVWSMQYLYVAGSGRGEKNTGYSYRRRQRLGRATEQRKGGRGSERGREGRVETERKSFEGQYEQRKTIRLKQLLPLCPPDTDAYMVGVDRAGVTKTKRRNEKSSWRSPPPLIN